MVTSVQSQAVSENIQTGAEEESAHNSTDSTVLMLERPRPKVGAVPLTFRHPAANDTSSADGWSDDTNGRAYKSDAQFMTLLLVLFIAVNALLAFLLYTRDKSGTHNAPQAAVAAASPVAHKEKVSEPAPAAGKTAILNVPSASQPAVVNTPVVEKSPAVVAAPVQSAPASAPVEVQQAKPAAPPKAYVTPINSDTSKATAAPVQRVVVTEHGNEQSLSPAAGKPAAAIASPVAPVQQDRPTSAAIPPAVPVVNMTQPVVAPAPASASGPTGTNDLLSVITKD